MDMDLPPDDTSQWPPRPTSEHLLDDAVAAELARYSWMRPRSKMLNTAAIMSIVVQLAVAVSSVIGIYKASALVLTIALGILYICSFCGVAALYLFWVAGAAANIVALTRRKPKFTAAYAVTAHLLPFVNLYRPWFIVRSIWDATAAAKDKLRGSRLISWWWWVWVGTNIVSVVLGVMIANNPTNTNFGAVAQATDCLADIIVTVLLIRVVSMISDGQDSAAEALGILKRRV